MCIASVCPLFPVSRKKSKECVRHLSPPPPPPRWSIEVCYRTSGKATWYAQTSLGFKHPHLWRPFSSPTEKDIYDTIAPIATCTTTHFLFFFWRDLSLLLDERLKWSSARLVDRNWTSFLRVESSQAALVKICMRHRFVSPFMLRAVLFCHFAEMRDFFSVPSVEIQTKTPVREAYLREYTWNSTVFNLQNWAWTRSPTHPLKGLFKV